MAATIARPRFQDSTSYHENGNAEAGPSRHPNSLVTDHQQSIHALSRLRLAVGYSSAAGAGEDSERKGSASFKEESALQEINTCDDEDVPFDSVADIKGKKPLRPKKYLCPREDCDKSFSKHAKLREHELSHTGEVSEDHDFTERSLIATPLYAFRDPTYARNAAQATSEPLILRRMRGLTSPQKKKRSRVLIRVATSDSGPRSI